MTWRPADWSPLASSDPAPGDPDDVAEIACEYRDTALEIERQARVLRALSTADGWDSEAGKAFAKDAGQLAGKLAKTHGRYATVSRELRNWAPSLREAQRETLAALNDAKDAEARKRANQAPAFSGLRNLVEDRTDEEEAADRRRQKAYDDASDDLAAAKRRCDRAVDAMDDDAERVARAIRDASDDDVKDGFWDKLKGIVRDHVKLIKWVAKIASWIGTAIAIVTIFIVAAPFWLVALGVAAGVAALAGYAALAAAGEESWVDAGLELFGLVTFGIGKVLAKSVKASLGALRAAGASHAGAAAAQKVLHQKRIVLRAAEWGRRVPLRPVRRFAAEQADRVYRAADDARAAARRAVLEVPMPTPSVLRRIRSLDGDLAQFADEQLRLGKSFSRVPEVVRGLDDVNRRLVTAVRVKAVELGTDIGNELRVFDPLKDALKPRFTCEVRPMRW